MLKSLALAHRDRELTVQRVVLPREKENHGRDRWLSADELAQFYLELPAEWVPRGSHGRMSGSRSGPSECEGRG
jgi:hypothetical protein